MKDFIKSVPLALSGLLLAMVALANILAGFFPPLKPIIQGLAILGLGLVGARLKVDWKTVKNEFHNPLVASCFATFFMAVQLLTGSLPLPEPFGQLLWYLNALAYLLYIIFFTKRFVLQRKLNLVYPSWFIVYVGFAMVAVTAPVYGQAILGWLALLIAGLGYLGLIPVVIYRLVKIPLPENQFPILAIFAAPTSLLLTAYLSLAEQVNLTLTIALLGLSQLIYGLVVFSLYRLMKNGFSPLFSAFTFPFVSTAIGLKLALSRLGLTQPPLTLLVNTEIVIAGLMVGYVLFSYIRLFRLQTALTFSLKKILLNNK